MRPQHPVLIAAVLLLILMGLGGVTAADSGTATGAARGGDLSEIMAEGRLRILVPPNYEGNRYLPRDGSPVDEQERLAATFAASLGLEAEVVPVAGIAKLLKALETGEGDIIAANLTATEARRERIGFSVPVDHVVEQLVVSSRNNGIEGPADLVGRTVLVDRGSSFWDTMMALKDEYPGIVLTATPQGLRDEDVIDLVAGGRVAATVRDSNVVQMYLGYRDDIRAAFDLSAERPIAWGIRRDAEELRRALDDFLHTEALTRFGYDEYKEDLPGLKKRRRIRVLLRNNAASYFLWRGELVGFEYELARAFARDLGLRLEVVVPPSHEAMYRWLKEGRADVAAGFLVPQERHEREGLAYTRPYHYAPLHVVKRADDPLSDIPGLDGRTFVVRQSSGHWNQLMGLRQLGVELTLRPAPEDMETEEIIGHVARGEHDLTLADEHLLDIELANGVDVASAFTLGLDRPHAVAVRAEDEELLAALNAFIRKSFKGVLYNVLYKKYFTNEKQIRRLALGRVELMEQGRLSPYDEFIKKYARQYGFDWRLVVAQMYQESRFRPDAESLAGARGLMQIVPRTAEQLGLEDLENPETSIHAGVKYLDWLRDRFDPELPVADRTWFALASYNAGHGHVYDARRLAVEKGWDPNRWFDNVEQAIRLLSKGKYAEKARHGWVRGGETAHYVRSIKQRFEAYVMATDGGARDGEALSLLMGGDGEGAAQVERQKRAELSRNSEVFGPARGG